MYKFRKLEELTEDRMRKRKNTNKGYIPGEIIKPVITFCHYFSWSQVRDSPWTLGTSNIHITCTTVSIHVRAFILKDIFLHKWIVIHWTTMFSWCSMPLPLILANNSYLLFYLEDICFYAICIASCARSNLCMLTTFYLNIFS